jgi:TrmH family RNA methyltransferase
MRQLRVVFVGCETGENAGFLARVVKNFGFREIWFVSPLVDVKKLGAKTAMHAVDVLERARIVDSLNEVLIDTDLLVGTTSTRPKSDKNLLRNYVTPREFASAWAQSNGVTTLLFGREGTGLSNRELDMCDFVVSIPTSRAYPAMNISHSAAVILYELANAVGVVKAPRNSASREDKELLLDLILGLLSKTNEPPHRSLLVKRSLRNILGRSYATKREVAILIGALRRIAKHCGESAINK